MSRYARAAASQSDFGTAVSMEDDRVTHRTSAPARDVLTHAGDSPRGTTDLSLAHPQQRRILIRDHRLLAEPPARIAQLA